VVPNGLGLSEVGTKMRPWNSSGSHSTWHCAHSANFAGRGGDIAETHRTLAYWIGAARERNDVVVERLYRCFSAACSALVVQVVVWVAALGGTLG
jgi:hypothetical protein